MTAIWKSIRKKFSKKSISEIIVYSIVFCIFAAFALSYLYIFFWGITAGLKTNGEIVLEPFSLPEVPQFQNYVEVFSKLEVNGVGFFGMVFNSLYFSVFGSFISGMLTSMIAYVACKYKFPGSRLLYLIVIVMITLPIYGNGGAMYKLLYDLGMVNSYTHILLATGGLSMNFLYYYAAYSSLSWSYAEAAFIDGANDWTVYFRVMFPQVLNLFGALFLLAWVADWNNYSSALIYLTKLPTLAGGIYLFELDMTFDVRLDILYAAYMISAVPPLLLFICFNNALTSNISLGGIKE